MLEYIPVRDLSKWKLKQFFPFLETKMNEHHKVLRKDTQYNHLGVIFANNHFSIFIRDRYKHLYKNTTIPYQFTYVPYTEILEQLGLNLKYNYFQKSDLQKYIKLQGFSYTEDENGNLVAHFDTQTTLEDIPNIDSNQLMLFTDKHVDKTTIPLVKGLTDLRVWIPNQSRRNVNRKDVGIAIDITTRYYKLDYLKKMVDLVKQYGGRYLRLKISSNSSYAIESAILKQKPDTRRKIDVYTNPITKKPYYSNMQMRSLILYAKTQGIELIPEINVISDGGGIRALMLKHDKYKDKAWFDARTGDWSWKEREVVNFVKDLIDEIQQLFKTNAGRLHLGAYNFDFDYLDQFEHVKYLNGLSVFMSTRGKVIQIDNDSITKENVEKLNKNIEVFYTSLVPRHVTDAEEKRKYLLRKATFSEIINQKIRVYNANYYYLSPIPLFTPATENIDYLTLEGLKYWRLGVWDKDNRGEEYPYLDKVVGSCIFLNDENIRTMPEDVMYPYFETYYATMISLGILHQPEDTSFYIDEMINNEFALTLVPAYIDIWQVAYREEISVIDMSSKAAKHITLLNEDELRTAKDVVFRVKGNERNSISLSDNWIEQTQSDMDGTTYTRYQYGITNNYMYLDHQIEVKRNFIL